MQKPFMRIPYTGPLPPPIIIPRSANTLPGAISAVHNFLRADSKGTVLLTGAGISVKSGLADYRGTAGTYTLNKTYRPIYYNEFVTSHEARKRYWARSFLGWTNLHRARPNSAHYAVKALGEMGVLRSVITQNVDSFPIPLRIQIWPRWSFMAGFEPQLNPAWAAFLAEMLEVGALDTENPDERRKKGLKTNPDGDVDLPDAPYTTFRYPPCPICLASPPKLPNGETAIVEADASGAWSDVSNAGVLKPAVIMFGESIPPDVKSAAEDAINDAGRILVVGSSLATYSAWRLVKHAKERGMPVGVLNIGGVRGEENFFKGLSGINDGSLGMRCSEAADEVLMGVVERLTGRRVDSSAPQEIADTLSFGRME